MHWNTTLGEKWPDGRDFRDEGPNPFERDGRGQIKSPGAISQVIRQDVARARAMCRAAGEPLSNWFAVNPR